MQQDRLTDKTNRRIPKQRIGLLLALPAIVVMIVTVVYPLAWALNISFQSSDSVISGNGGYVGLSNYVQVLTSEEFYLATINTIGFVLITVSLELLIGVAIALALNLRLRANGLFVMLISFPLMMAPIVAGFIWRWLFADQYGIINHLLTYIGIENHYWFTTPIWSKTAVLIANLWQTTPFVILILYAALSGISEEVNEAARMDGANGFKLFRHITLPLLKPAILLVLVIRIADAFRIYDLVYILTGGGPANATSVMNTYIYRRTFSDFMFGQGAAASFIVTVLIMAISYVSFSLLRPKKGEAA